MAGPILFKDARVSKHLLKTSEQDACDGFHCARGNAMGRKCGHDLTDGAR